MNDVGLVKSGRACAASPLLLLIFFFFSAIENEIRGVRRRMSTLDDKAGREDLDDIGELSLRDSKEESDKVRGIKLPIMIDTFQVHV